MFALEISFADGSVEPETVFVKRTQAIIGASKQAHVEIQDMQSLSYDLRILRGSGRKFKVLPVARSREVQVPSFLESAYDEHAEVDLGVVKLNITALDSDLLMKDGETPDRSGVRVLRQACSSKNPEFPAIVVLGEAPTVYSFVTDSPVYIGTAKNCGLRTDISGVSARHARIGFESGDFWVEDLGSTHGTFVNNSQISGRTTVAPGVPISLGKFIALVGVVNEQQISIASSMLTTGSITPHIEERRYPVLVSVSEVARPARLVLPIDADINIGRDPSSDIWLGAPHVSRRHCSFIMSKNDSVSVSDHSTNGTSYDDGVLRRGDIVKLSGKAKVFDLGGGVTIALCFNEHQEKAFVAANGDANVFKGIDTNTAHSAMSLFGNRESRSKVMRLPSLKPEAVGGWQRNFHNVVTFYRALGYKSKLVLFITVFAFVTVLVVVINLLVRLNF
jgi:pSer/pThr/pTyr-binding forkhead associated (FHA) protein